ncbi:MAG: 3-deoxy-D-manno-octulosonic acid transferase [Alphaproteobacteria bacterium]|nr:3-deoxy-D-manno-octulosonic acid transferase [Alphaproteobacteria bacterium]
MVSVPWWYSCLGFAWGLAWQYRQKNGKIDPFRAHEYQGCSKILRPTGTLIWIHGVSVGESVSTLPLIRALQLRFSDVRILLTSSTRSSSSVLEIELPKDVIHQYLPMDHGDWVARFYDHWQPDLGCWVESELWPNLCLEADRRNIPRVLLNGRMSVSSVHRWVFLPNLIKAMVTGFRMIRVQDQQQLGIFHSFDGMHAQVGSNLKDAASALRGDGALHEEWEQRVRGRLFWLASSTHPGEEEIVIAAHQRLKREFPELLCLLVPRHPGRGGKLLQYIRQKTDFSVQLASENKAYDPQCAVYIADALGQLGVFYRLVPMAFIGGSLVAKGGHNMREALLLRCLPIVGPNLDNFTQHKAHFAKYLTEVHDANSLAEAVAVMLRTPEEITRRADEAAEAVQTMGVGVIEEIMRDLAPLIDQARS